MRLLIIPMSRKAFVRLWGVKDSIFSCNFPKVVVFFCRIIYTKENWLSRSEISMIVSKWPGETKLCSECDFCDFMSLLSFVMSFYLFQLKRFLKFHMCMAFECLRWLIFYWCLKVSFPLAEQVGKSALHLEVNDVDIKWLSKSWIL